VLLLACLSPSGCRYLRNRSIDFIDQFHLTVGAGTVVGVRTKAVGVVDTGIMGGIKPNATSLGWRYGKITRFNTHDGRYDSDAVQIIKANSVLDFDYGDGSYRSARDSWAILPAVFTWTDSSPEGYDWEVPEEGEEYPNRHWLWSDNARDTNGYAQVHAFDIEAEVALGIYISSGFSPGETVDFILGFFGIDIAKDDTRLDAK